MIQDYSPETFPFVILTGGSSGIGKEFLHSILNIPHEGMVFNISRTKPEFSFMPKRPFEHIFCDLNSLEETNAAVQRITKTIEESSNQGPILLINNSGIGNYDAFDGLDLDQELSVVDVNIKAVMVLTHKLLPLLEKNGGAVMNISSIVSYVPMPFMATYSASKAFLLHWGLALSVELKKKGVHVLTVCPGRTNTAFAEHASKEKPVKQGNPGQPPAEVVQESFDALKKRKAVLVCGRMNKLVAFVLSKIPKALVVRAIGIVRGNKKRKSS